MSHDPESLSRGVKLLHDPLRNKGTAFSQAERDALGLRGLLPPRASDLPTQVARVLENTRSKSNDLERYLYLIALQDRNETLFYRVVVDHLEELMPILYTPTVGRACLEYGHIFRRPRGLFVSANDLGRVAEVLRNWPHEDVRIIVVTDGGRILGLGDLGVDGMGIPVGKLALYTACAGIRPEQCLPITLDVGTESEARRCDPLYLGLQQKRLEGEAYDALVDEFVDAVREVFPDAVLQLEDFANRNAFRLLERYRHLMPCFDDDIQGTGAVALAGVQAAMRLTGGKLKDQTFVFLGAGEAGIGIASMIVAAMQAEGLTEAEARRRCWLVDSKGLVVRERDDLADHKLPYAHDHAPLPDLLSAIEELQPTALIGVSGAPETFQKRIVETMARLNERPIVFALSNPTAKAECTAEQAIAWTGGRAIFASGSPFPPVEWEGRRIVPGQGNNAYVFPGVGLGAIACGARQVTDEMFFEAASCLAAEVHDEDLALARVYPPFSRIREVSLSIAVAVAEVAWMRGLARVERPADPTAYIRQRMYEPNYTSYL
ncbi:MAG: NAD-dependent malic enzyme [bacterium]|nr:NAD-dependent malic enzyme [bacterium]